MLAGATQAGALGNGRFAVSPTSVTSQSRQDFTPVLAAGTTSTDRMSVENLTTKPITLELYAADAYNTPTGGFAIEPNFKPKKHMGAWIHLAVPSLQLQPLTGDIVPFTYEIPDNEPPGDYPGGIVAVQTTGAPIKHGHVRVRAEYAIAIPVLGRVSGPLSPRLSVTAVSVATSGSVGTQFGGPVDATVTYSVTNSGNQYLKPTITVSLSPLIGGGSHYQQKLPGALLPGSTVTFHHTFDNVVPFGSLSASVTAHGTGVKATGSSTAIVIPWGIVAIVVLLVAVIVLVVRRRRRSRTGPSDLAAPGGSPPGPGGGAAGAHAGGQRRPQRPRPVRQGRAALRLAAAAVVGSALGAGALAAGASAGTQGRVVLSTTTIVPGQRVAVTGSGWVPRTVLNAVVCGANAVAGTADCANTATSELLASPTGLITTHLTGAIPPQPCPCVVLVNGVNVSYTEKIPVTVVGASTAPVPAPPPFVQPDLAVRDLHVDAPLTVASAMGASAPRTVVLLLHNAGTATETPTLLGRWGRAGHVDHVIAMPAVKAVAPGASERVRAPFSLPALATGTYTVRVTVEVVGFRREAAATTSTVQWPVGLFALGALLLLAVVVLLATGPRRRRRRGRRVQAPPGQPTPEPRLRGQLGGERGAVVRRERAVAAGVPAGGSPPDRVGPAPALVAQPHLRDLAGGRLGQRRRDAHEPRGPLGAEVGLVGQPGGEPRGVELGPGPQLHRRHHLVPGAGPGVRHAVDGGHGDVRVA